MKTETKAKETNLQIHLAQIGACAEAHTWAGSRTAQQAWDECERADWLMWWIGKTYRTHVRKSNSHKNIVLVACACARRALTHVPAKESRPLHWAEAYAAASESAGAADAAYAAARAASDNATTDEAAGAADAADAADAARSAARVVVEAAARVADAAARAAADAADAARVANEARAVYMAAYAAEHKELCIEVRKLLVCPIK